MRLRFELDRIARPHRCVVGFLTNFMMITITVAVTPVAEWVCHRAIVISEYIALLATFVARQSHEVFLGSCTSQVQTNSPVNSLETAHDSILPTLNVMFTGFECRRSCEVTDGVPFPPVALR